MYRFLVTTLALITGFFALMFSLLLTIPLAIAAVITGKRLEKQLKRRPFYQAQGNPGHVIDGEFEDVSGGHHRSS